MRNPNASGVLRIAAGVMVLITLAAVLFSAFYIAAEADHDCSGEDCPVCACIRQCEQVFRGVGYGTAARSVAAASFIPVLTVAAFFAAAAAQDTLVSGKVRLNN